MSFGKGKARSIDEANAARLYNDLTLVRPKFISAKLMCVLMHFHIFTKAYDFFGPNLSQGSKQIFFILILTFISSNKCVHLRKCLNQDCIADPH